ncbi:hypothetical protein BU15DRAFT_67559 [Melanogaster broomeanus]|nr:hypothetical protein BU15DRAFT_67559 [Melanogaster broomeanus]
MASGRVGCNKSAASSEYPIDVNALSGAHAVNRHLHHSGLNRLVSGNNVQRSVVGQCMMGPMEDELEARAQKASKKDIDGNPVSVPSNSAAWLQDELVELLTLKSGLNMVHGGHNIKEDPCAKEDLCTKEDPPECSWKRARDDSKDDDDEAVLEHIWAKCVPNVADMQVSNHRESMASNTFHLIHPAYAHSLKFTPNLSNLIHFVKPAFIHSQIIVLGSIQTLSLPCASLRSGTLRHVDTCCQPTPHSQPDSQHQKEPGILLALLIMFLTSIRRIMGTRPNVPAVIVQLTLWQPTTNNVVMTEIVLILHHLPIPKNMVLSQSSGTVE